MQRTFEEVNERIKAGKAVVLTAEEAARMVAESSVAECAKKVDVVTTATFGPMCSSGAFLNLGHSEPPIRMGKIFLNDVEGYGGLAAVDTYIGATQPSETQGIAYGGAHVIEDLVNGKSVRLRAYSQGTDCYPRKEAHADITLDTVNQAFLFNPRNAYQNYAAAVNGSNETIYTYMGTLLPQYGSVTYSTSGELSPLLKDPELRAIGVGTRVFLGGAQGYVSWEGTQSVFNHDTTPSGDDWYAGVTLSVVGDLKKMSPKYLRAAVYEGYGVSLFVGLGIPIPVLDEDLMEKLAMPNERLYTRVFDYSVPHRARPSLGWVNYAQLRGGSVTLDNGKTAPCAALSSLQIAREIAALLKERVQTGQFLLQAPIMTFPRNPFKPLQVLEEES